MAPEYGETQALSHFGIQPRATSVRSEPDEVELPSMEDLDTLVAELDVIDATLARLG
jgi:hypothetical protein